MSKAHSGTLISKTVPIAALALSACLALGAAGCSSAANVASQAGEVAQQAAAGLSDQSGGAKDETATSQAGTQASDTAKDGAATATRGTSDTAAKAGGIEYPGGDTTGVLPAAPDWTLTDQDGTTHKLSDYRGKVVLVNFWATWCPYCIMEMPDLQAIYEDHGKNEGDFVMLGVAGPSSDTNPNNVDEPQDVVMNAFTEIGCTYPVLMDTTGSVFDAYSVYSLPSTIIIDPYGNVYAEIPGAASRAMFEQIVDKALAGDLTGSTTMRS